MNIDKFVKRELQHIMKLFANKEYNALQVYLENDTSIDDFLIWLHDYCIASDCERIVTIPPNEAFDEIDIAERTKNKKAIHEFYLIFDLWVDGQKSDLTLECEVEYYNDNDIRFYLHDLHVM